MKSNATELACVRSKGLCITEKCDGWGKLLSQTSAGGCQGTFATSVPDESESRSTRRNDSQKLPKPPRRGLVSIVVDLEAATASRANNTRVGNGPTASHRGFCREKKGVAKLNKASEEEINEKG